MKKLAKELISISKLLKTAETESILEKYPQTNMVWSLSKGRMFVTEASNLTKPWKDPWNRIISTTTIKSVEDDEGEITHWEGYTTVHGQKIELVILND